MKIKTYFPAVLLLMFSALVHAGGSLAGFSAKKQSIPLSKDPIALLVLADQVATFGETNNDALGYIMAAKIQKNLRIKSMISQELEETDSSRYDFFIGRAKVLAGQNKELLAIVQNIDESRSRGVLGGISQYRGVLKSGDAQSFKLSFKGEESAGVALLLDFVGGSVENPVGIDLDLYVRDEEGRKICNMEGPGVPELCTWTPMKTGKFSAQVVNRGTVDAPFVLNFR